MYRVLYVDDEPGILELVRIYLESYGSMMVDTCPSADEAKNLVKKTNYDTIVLDYYMPDGDGIEFLKEIRQSGLDCPIIIYTGRGKEDVVIDALNNGADFYLQKYGEPGKEFADLYAKVILAIENYHAQKRVKETTALLRSTLESTADGILVADSQGKITAWNRKFIEMWNIPHHFIEERDYSAVLSCILPQITDPNLFFNQVEPKKKDGIRPGTDILYLRNGKVYERYSHPQMIDGEIVGKVWSFRDITDKKNVEEALRVSEERFRILFEQAPVPSISLDNDGRIIEANEAVTRLIGYTKAELIGKSFVNYVAGYTIRDYEQLFHDVVIGKTVFNSELGIIHSNGREIPVMTCGKMLSADPEMGVRSVWNFMDLSEQKMIELQKEEIIRQIQDTLANLAALNDEIRNPLMVIAGQAELALGERAAGIMEQVREIDHIIAQLNQRWHESTRILKYMHHHQSIFLHRSDEI
mgnify:CR=1 FL=1